MAVLCGASLRVWGYGSLDLVVFALAVTGLALLAIAVAVVASAALTLRGDRRTAPASWPARLEADRPVRTGLSLPALERVPLVALDWSVAEPSGFGCRVRSEAGRASEELTPTRRGIVQRVRRRFRVGDAFGLTRIRWEREEAASFVVLPATRGLRRLVWLRALASGEGMPHPAGRPEGDRMEMRRYVPGDSVRHILWKTFARSRQLEVRTPERSVHRARRTLAYLVAGADDEAAAAAARVALESRALGEAWLFGADGTDVPTDRLEAALRAIARSADARAPGGDALHGLRRFLAAARADGATHCVVFAPPGLLAAAAALSAVLRASGASATCVFAVDGLRERAATRPLWERLLFAPPPATGLPVAGLSAQLARFSSPACTAVVVDRATGRVVAGRLEPAWRLSA